MARRHGKRWLKGHSCVSNPQANKYRENAKSRYFAPEKSSEQSSLTVDALSKHNEALNENFEEECDDSRSLGNLSIETFAENWSKCGNSSFNRFFKAFDASSNIHKELLSVIAAVSEVIKSQNGKETDTEYFAALMVTLESLEELDSTIAVVILMRMLCKRLPQSILKVKFSEVSKMLIELLDKYSEAESTLLIKEVLRCLSIMLRVQEVAVWKHSSTLHVYQLILNYTVHTKPKIRKEGLTAVSSILNSYYILGKREDGSEFHPASTATANFAIQQIEECGGAGDTTVILYMLSLLRNILGILPSSSVKKICETILRLMTFGNTIVTYQAIQALLGMLSTRPTPNTLPAKLNAQLINALYDYRPSLTDSRSLVSWLLLMQEAHINLWRLDDQLCLSNLPRFFQTCVQCWLSEHKETQTSATKALKNLLYGIVQPLGSKQADHLRSGPSSPVVKMFQCVEHGLKFQFHAVLKHVLHVLAVFFEVAGEHCKTLTIESLKSLADLRETENFAYNNELDYAVGMAVRHMGPQHVLDAIPLQFIGSGETCNLSRSWLLPVVRDYIQETELSLFISYFYPLAVKCQEKASELSQSGPTAVSQTYKLIEAQIWSLLPGFCSKPVDLVDSFLDIAKLLGKMLKERPELRLNILSSLRLLINKNEGNERNIQELAKYSKNYLPILFNLYTDEPANLNDKGSRFSAYETIKVYLKISDVQLRYTLFDKAILKLEEAIDNFKRQAVTDLMRALLPYLDEGRIEKLFKIASNYCQNEDRTLQKKAYRIFDDILSESSENCKIFAQKFRTAFEKILFQSAPLLAPSAKAIRLHCFIMLARLLPNPNKAFVNKVVPEAVLCMKEPSKKTYSEAAALLVEVGHKLIEWNDKPKQEILKEYLQSLIAGLAGSPYIISATIDSITCIFQQFKDIVTSDMLAEVAQHICILLSSHNREVKHSAIAFVSFLISNEKPFCSSPYLLNLVETLVNVPDEDWKFIRFKIRPLLEKLIKKMGFENTAKLFPAKRRKMIMHVRKLQEREKKKRAMKMQAKSQQSTIFEDSPEFTKAKTEALEDILRDSDDDDDDDKDEKKKVGAKKEASAWLSEGFEDSIVDFLDPKIVQNISATQPKQKPSDDNHGFKLSEDGKLIIVDPEEQKRKDKKGPEDIDDSNLFLEAISSKQTKNKRKFEDDSDEEKDESSVKYHAGGSGIHRPTISRDTKKNPETGPNYKAKSAGGDVKRKGKPDPYTYIPLNVSYLNRRKQAKMSSQFSGLIKGAKKGAQKGKQCRFRPKRK